MQQLLEEIYLIDFSCALFEDIDEGEYVSSRESRRSRRTIKERAIYGGRKSRKRHNTNKNRRKINKQYLRNKTKKRN